MTISGYDPLNILGQPRTKTQTKSRLGSPHRHTTLVMTVKYGPNLIFTVEVVDISDDLEACNDKVKFKSGGD